MKRRWLPVAGYMVLATVQVALIAGTWVLHQMSQERMMLMRYLYARNLELETSWFSSASVTAQAVCFSALGIGLVALSLLQWRRHARFASIQGIVGALLASTGAWLALSFDASEVYALYAGVAAVWAALLLQLAVVGMALRSRAAASGPAGR